MNCFIAYIDPHSKAYIFFETPSKYADQQVEALRKTGAAVCCWPENFWRNRKPYVEEYLRSEL